jgi:phage tail-like protein
MTGERRDPFINFNFTIEIDGINRAAFHECSGFNSTIDVIEHREGGAITPSKLPGQVKYGNVTLKRGITDDVQLYAWHQGAAAGNVERRNGSIVLRDRLGEETARWNFFEAWPTKWEGPALSAEGTDVAIETLELAVERLERA